MLTKKQIEQLKQLSIDKPHIGIIYRDLIDTIEEMEKVIRKVKGKDEFLAEYEGED